VGTVGTVGSRTVGVEGVPDIVRDWAEEIEL
jgi:hypothetical protein